MSDREKVAKWLWNTIVNVPHCIWEDVPPVTQEYWLGRADELLALIQGEPVAEIIFRDGKMRVSVDRDWRRRLKAGDKLYLAPQPERAYDPTGSTPAVVISQVVRRREPERDARYIISALLTAGFMAEHRFFGDAVEYLEGVLKGGPEE